MIKKPCFVDLCQCLCTHTCKNQYFLCTHTPIKTGKEYGQERKSDVLLSSHIIIYTLVVLFFSQKTILNQKISGSSKHFPQKAWEFQ